MFENITPILYLLTGFIVTYLGLEIAWHFTACRIHDKAIKPCMFKQLETLILVRSSIVRGLDNKAGIYDAFHYEK